MSTQFALWMYLPCLRVGRALVWKRLTLSSRPRCSICSSKLAAGGEVWLCAQRSSCLLRESQPTSIAEPDGLCCVHQNPGPDPAQASAPNPPQVDQGAMTVGAMAKVERRYSRKVGDSFRRDKEHLALFEELADHYDLDSSLAAMDSNVLSEFIASAQGGIEDNVLELDGNKSEDEWLVTIPEVTLSLKPGQQNVVTNDSLSSIRTSRVSSKLFLCFTKNLDGLFFSGTY